MVAVPGTVWIKYVNYQMPNEARVCQHKKYPNTKWALPHEPIHLVRTTFAPMPAVTCSPVGCSASCQHQTPVSTEVCNTLSVQFTYNVNSCAFPPPHPPSPPPLRSHRRSTACCCQAPANYPTNWRKQSLSRIMIATERVGLLLPVRHQQQHQHQRLGGWSVRYFT